MTQENLPGRYTILRELGRGAIGAVYAARDASTGTVVALKILDPALVTEANARLAELFLKNARSSITTLELAPGMHQIEVRSGSRKPYVTYMTVQPGEERRIRHDFHAKPSRPPR
jgi:serine/threonine protein kinase